MCMMRVERLVLDGKYFPSTFLDYLQVLYHRP